MKCEQEMCPFWSGSGCVCEVVDLSPSDVRLAANASEGWAAYAAERERHAETTARLEEMTREARLSREATEKAVASRFSRSEVERALRAAGPPEDSMATDDLLIHYEGRAEAVEIVRIMLELDQ